MFTAEGKGLTPPRRALGEQVAALMTVCASRIADTMVSSATPQLRAGSASAIDLCRQDLRECVRPMTMRQGIHESHSP
jgi:hypothetical protein